MDKDLMSFQEELEKLLVELLHRFDKEPDEITKYVVIDQTEFVPEALTSIINLVDKEIIGEDATEGFLDRPPRIFNELRAEQRAKLKGVSNG